MSIPFGKNLKNGRFKPETLPGRPCLAPGDLAWHQILEYGGLITRGSSDFHYKGINDDILNLIFRERYQEEIDRLKPDVDSILAAKIEELEKNKKSLLGTDNN